MLFSIIVVARISENRSAKYSNPVLLYPIIIKYNNYLILIIFIKNITK